MKKIIKKIIIFVLYYSGLSWLRSLFLRHKVFCIGYHSVWDTKNKNELQHNLYWNISVSAEDFEKQLVYMKKRGHSFIHFADLDKLETKTLSKPTIVYFDDGFKDVLQNALPILTKHAIPATIFITTGLIDRTHFLWTLSLRYFLLQQGMDEMDIEKKIAELKKFGVGDREKNLEKLYTENSFILRPEDFNIFLNWQDVLTLKQNNIEIGSHGIAHQKFTELNETELEHELVDSKKILEEKTGSRVETLSYPYGRHNEMVENSAKKASYKYALSTIIGLNDFQSIKNRSFLLKKISFEGALSDTHIKILPYIKI